MLFEIIQSVIEKVDWEDKAIQVDIAWRQLDDLLGKDTYPSP